MKYFIIRSLPLDRDSRTQRYETIIDDPNAIFRYITLEKKSMIGYITFLLKLFFLLPFIVSKNDIIICMDLDVFIVAKLSLFYKKNIIYLDIVDPIAETKFRKLPNFIKKIFDYLEYFSLKFRKYNILPANYRKLYYKEKLEKDVNNLNYIVVENVPIYNGEFSIKTKKFPLNSNQFIIGYFGILEKERGIIELIEWILDSDLNIKIIVAGRGTLENKISLISSDNNEKVKFMGSFKPIDVCELYENVDFNWSYYDVNSRLLHYKYACPNKFYESIFFYTPLIINKGVFISNVISENSVGIVIDDELSTSNFEKMYELMRNFTYNKNKFDLLNSKYRNYKFKLNSGFKQ
jgi:hypothetical protein